MKAKGLNKLLLAALLLGFCGSSWAVVFPTPDPLPPNLPPGTTLGADIDGNGLFTPVDPLMSLEIFDLAEAPAIPGTGIQFGFYYASDPSALIPIFRAVDITNNRPQIATVNFAAGTVIDDNTNTLESSFTPKNEQIGFYILNPAIPSIPPLFTQAILNDSSNDWAAAYPVIGTPGAYLIGFADPTTIDPTTGTNRPAYAALIGPPPPPSPIPIPGAIFLWLTGLAGVALFRRCLARGQSGDCNPGTALAAR